MTGHQIKDVSDAKHSTARARLQPTPAGFAKMNLKWNTVAATTKFQVQAASEYQAGTILKLFGALPT